MPHWYGDEARCPHSNWEVYNDDQFVEYRRCRDCGHEWTVKSVWALSEDEGEGISPAGPGLGSFYPEMHQAPEDCPEPRWYGDDEDEDWAEGFA